MDLGIEEASAKYKKGVLHVTIHKDQNQSEVKSIPMSVN